MASSWLRSAITNPHTGEQSSKSVALLLTVLVLACVLVALIALAVFKVSVDATLAQAITGVAAALAGISGTGYAVGKVSGAYAARPSTPPIAPTPARKPDPQDKEECD